MGSEGFDPKFRQGSQTPPVEERLETWGPIAAYLKVDQRTAQRWEETANLPIYRLQGRVYAYKSELDKWVENQRPAARPPEPPPPSPGPAGRKRLVEFLRRYAKQRTLAKAAAVVVLVILGAYLAWRYWPRPQSKVMLVVLPFENLSGDPQQKYYCDEFTEELTTQLARLHPESLGVIAATSARKVISKSIGEIERELRVRYVLEGSMTQHSGNEVHITARLIQVRDQTQLWADSYSRSEEDVLALQSDVAGAIARQIQLKLTPQEQSRLEVSRPVNPSQEDLKSRRRRILAISVEPPVERRQRVARPGCGWLTGGGEVRALIQGNETYGFFPLQPFLPFHRHDSRG